MEYRLVCQNDIAGLLNYNDKVFPERTGVSETYIMFLFSKSSQEYKNSVLIDHNGMVRGQMLASSMQFFYGGEVFNSYWAYDLIVDEELRKDAYGLDLIMLYNRVNKVNFSTGSGPTALKLHLALGSKWMGEIRKYVGIGNLLGLPTSLFRGVVSPSKFPQTVNVDGTIFARCSADEIEWNSTPFNNTLWEPTRDNHYMRWRFSSLLHEYAIYRNAESGNYFVLRTIVKKGITALVLVDFRCNLNQSREFCAILQAVRKIMRKMWLAILICGSSHAEVDRQLERMCMRSIGRPRPIIGRANYKDRKEDIANRNFALVTLADSDGETLW